MKLLLVLISIAASLLLTNAASRQQDCSRLMISSAPGYYWDLSPLMGQTFYANTTAIKFYEFEWRICGALPSCENRTDAAVCQEWDTYQASCGIWDPLQIDAVFPTNLNDGIQINVINGSIERYSEIVIYCDPNATSPRNFSAVAAPVLLAPYIVSMSHVSGCKLVVVPSGSPISTPSSKKKWPLSAGSIMLIVIAAILVVYFVSGFLINKCRGIPGFGEAVPNSAFWLGLPRLLADGANFLAWKCGCRQEFHSYELVTN